MIAHDIRENCFDYNQIFTTAVLTGKREGAMAFDGEFCYPMFTFEDGSILEFEVKQNRYILKVRAWCNYQDMLDDLTQYIAA